MDAELQTFAREITDFETALANISVKDEDRRDPSAYDHPKTLKQFNDEYFGSVNTSKINAISFVKSWFATPGLDVVVDETEIINDNAPGYFQKLGPLLASTEDRIIGNYMVYRVIWDNIGMLTSDFRAVYLDFRKVLYGVATDRPRDELCINSYANNIDNLGEPVGRLYVDKYFPPAARASANRMVDDLKAAFTKQIQDVAWMDDVTRAKAIEKNLAMARRIGYPDYVKNDAFLNEMDKNTT